MVKAIEVSIFVSRITRYNDKHINRVISEYDAFISPISGCGYNFGHVYLTELALSKENGHGYHLIPFGGKTW